jgi:hypothetical protein
MKIKTRELTGAALDWSVGDIEFKRLIAQGSYVKQWVLDDHVKGLRTNPYSSDWSQGGPIIEREKISVELKPHGYWMASYQYNYADEKRFLTLGDTPLIAAMRCYVASRLGDEVEIPGELLEENE